MSLVERNAKNTKQSLQAGKQQGQSGQHGLEMAMTDMKRNKKIIAPFAATLAVGFAALSLCLTGCGIGLSSLADGAKPTPSQAGPLLISGNVHGGQNPVSGAAIQLYVVGSTGLQSAASPLISASQQVVYNPAAPAGTTGALTDAGGSFTLTGDYTCPTPSQQLYLVATGGNSGSGTNSAIAMMAPVGDCATLTSNAATTYVQINELTTIASVYALAPFMSSYTNVGAATINAPGLINAVANFNSLVNLSTGTPGGASLPAGAVVNTTEINSLGDILAACINSSGSGSGSCNILFTATSATNTINAALAIAKNPGSATYTALNNTLVSATAPFQPSYTANPNDWTLSIKYTAGGVLSTPYGIAIDASGNAWVTNASGSSVVEIGPQGTVGSTLTGGGLIGPKGIAIDRAGDIWITNPATNSVVEFNNAGTLLSATGYTAGGLNGPVSIALDSQGDAWVANLTGNSVTELSSTGGALKSSLTAGGTISIPTGISLDTAGNVYVANNGGGNVVKLINTTGAAATGSPFTDLASQGTTAVAIDTSSDVWATGSTTGTAIAGAVSQFTSTGTAASYSPLGGGGLLTPAGVATSGTTAWVTNYQTSGSLSEAVLGQSAPVSPSAGLGAVNAADSVPALNAPIGVAVDPSGDVWTANSGDNTVSVFIGLATPVVTPLAAIAGP